MAKKANNTSPTKAVLGQKGNGQSRYVAKRVIKLNNRQVANQVRHIEYFALNYSSASSGFIKAGQSESITLYDHYVETLLETAHKLITDQLEQLTPVYDSYIEQGYVFDASVKPAEVTVQIARNCVNDFIQLLLDLDKLVTMFNHLEKTPFLKTPAMFSLVQEWSDIPRKVNSRLQGMAKKLNDKFNFNPKAQDIRSLQIDFEKVNQVLEQYQRDKAQLFAKEPPKSVEEANIASMMKQTQPNQVDKKAKPAQPAAKSTKPATKSVAAPKESAKSPALNGTKPPANAENWLMAE